MKNDFRETAAEWRMWCIVDYVLVQEEPFTVIWLASVESRLQWSDLTRWKARPPSREGLEIHFSPWTAYCQKELMSTLHTIFSEALPNSFRLCSLAVSQELEEEFLSMHGSLCFKSVQNVLSFPLMDVKDSSWTSDKVAKFSVKIYKANFVPVGFQFQ